MSPSLLTRRKYISPRSFVYSGTRGVFPPWYGLPRKRILERVFIGQHPWLCLRRWLLLTRETKLRPSGSISLNEVSPIVIGRLKWKSLLWFYLGRIWISITKTTNSDFESLRALASDSKTCLRQGWVVQVKRNSEPYSYWAWRTEWALR